MVRLRDSWCTSLHVAQQPRNPQPESVARKPYHSGAPPLEANTQSLRSRTAKLWPPAFHPLTTFLPAWLSKELLTKEEVVDGQPEACRAAQTRRRGLECMAARAPEDPPQLIQGGPDPGE